MGSSTKKKVSSAEFIKSALPCNPSRHFLCSHVCGAVDSKPAFVTVSPLESGLWGVQFREINNLKHSWPKMCSRIWCCTTISILGSHISFFSAGSRAPDAVSVCVSSNREILLFVVLAGNSLLRLTPTTYPTLGMNSDWHSAMWTMCVGFAFSARFFFFVLLFLGGVEMMFGFCSFSSCI